jgi:hypothetical protein
MTSSKSIIFITIIIIYILTIVSAAANSDKSQGWKNRPRQFRMQVFSRPNNKGAVQTIRAVNSGKFVFVLLEGMVFTNNLYNSFLPMLEFSI